MSDHAPCVLCGDPVDLSRTHVEAPSRSNRRYHMSCFYPPTRWERIRRALIRRFPC